MSPQMDALRVEYEAKQTGTGTIALGVIGLVCPSRRSPTPTDHCYATARISFLAVFYPAALAASATRSLRALAAFM